MMVEPLSDMTTETYRVAHRHHVCGWCGECIQAGWWHYSIILEDRQRYQHADCRNAVARFFDDSDDVFDMDVFDGGFMKGKTHRRGDPDPNHTGRQERIDKQHGNG